MSETRNIFIQVIEKPVRKVIIKRGCIELMPVKRSKPAENQ